MAYCGHLTRFVFILTFLFGLISPSIQYQKEIEISEIFEYFEYNPNIAALERHDIVRRAAASPSLPSVHSSTAHPDPAISSTSVSKLSVTPKIPSSPVNHSAVSSSPSQTRSSSSFISIKSSAASSSSIPNMSVANLPTTQAPTTSKQPTTKLNASIATSTSKETEHSTTPDVTPVTVSSHKDNHIYYTSHYQRSGKQWWFNLDDGSAKPKFHSELSTNTKFSDLLQTSFSFPYYGHLINNVTITNKGYLFLGERLHKFHASAQYAAPLMADFGAELHPRTSIRYLDTGNRLTVEWANMRLKNEAEDKEFSFQCSILSNGTLIFAYKNIPKAVNELNDSRHFVRVGISDTFKREEIRRGVHIIGGKRYTSVRYILYYLYHKVELDKESVVSNSAIVLTPLPNCVMFNSCDTCLNTRTNFDCRWCVKINRCSDGIDRHRMEWETAGCMKDGKKSCSSDSSTTISGGVIAVIVIVPHLVIFFVVWFVYAYYHPQSKSGLFLIKYGNPTKWFRNSSGNDTHNSSSTDGRISFKTMPFESNA